MYILRPEPLSLGTHYYLHTGDWHIESPEVDYELIKRELKTAKQLGAKLRINGDLFDCILPSDHKKYRPDAVHKRLQGRSDIVNGMLDWAEELLEGQDIEMLGSGNHDDWMLKHHSTDIIQLLCERLGCQKAYSGYTCFIQNRFTDKNRHTHIFDTFVHHGAGGGSSLSSAINEFPKKLQFVDADLIWVAHRHFRLFTHMRRLSCPRGGPEPKYIERYFLMTGSYMDNWTTDIGTSRRASYAEDKGLPPQGKGGIILSVRATTSGITMKTEIE